MPLLRETTRRVLVAMGRTGTGGQTESRIAECLVCDRGHAPDRDRHSVERRIAR